MADGKTTKFELNCPVPRVADDRIVLAHGGGGRLTHQLIEKIFLPAFSNAMLEERHDGTVLPINGSRLAFTTDFFVVRPLIFPGGTIGDLAVNGTVNDLATPNPGTRDQALCAWPPESRLAQPVRCRRRSG